MFGNSVCVRQILPNHSSKVVFSVSFCCITNHLKMQWLKTITYCSLDWCSSLESSGMVLLCSMCVSAGFSPALAVSWWLVASFTFLAVGWSSVGATRLTWQWGSHNPASWSGFIHMVMVAVCQEQQKRTNSNIPGLFKPFLVSHLLMSHWPRHVTWPSPDSRNRWRSRPFGGRNYNVSCKLHVLIANAYTDGYSCGHF